MSMNIKDERMHNDMFETKRDIFYAKNDKENLLKVLKCIQSAFSNRRSPIFVAISLITTL